jgi:hypothetical protein
MTKIQCNECEKIHLIEDDELNFECVATDHRQMGPENTYSGEISFDCDKCNNSISAEFTFWEYPAMALNDTDFKTEGCEVIEHPDYQAFLIESDSDED